MTSKSRKAEDLTPKQRLCFRALVRFWVDTGRWPSTVELSAVLNGNEGPPNPWVASSLLRALERRGVLRLTTSASGRALASALTILSCPPGCEVAFAQYLTCLHNDLLRLTACLRSTERATIDASIEARAATEETADVQLPA